ncbi:MAG: hypothetical protein IKJ91_02355 [Clostridia bacterium]|nr:hypothetical protein [Clostridia bacterium]
MKKHLILVALLLIALVFASCGEKAPSNSGAIVLKTIDNISDYVIVRSGNSSSEVTQNATSLRKAINEATGAGVSIKTDDFKSKCEILVGETSRQESIDAHEGLRSSDYLIKMVGNKIVIAGGSDEALADACKFFKTNFINAEGKWVKAPTGDGYRVMGKYLVDSLSVDGVDISEFSVYYEGVLLDTENIMARLSEAFGADISLVTKNEVKDDHYIYLDNSGLIEHEYSIEILDGDIYIRGSFNTIDDAIDYFLGDYLGGKKEIALKSVESNSGIMSTGKKEIYTKDQLMQVLTDVYNDPNSCIIGQQCFHGVKDMVGVTIADFEKSTGQKPGIIGIDTGCYGVMMPTITPERLSQLVCETVDYCADGGIVTCSAHWTNPYAPDQLVRGKLGEFSTPEEYEAALRAVFTPGNEYYDFFMEILSLDADLFEALENNGVPMIYRPIHEMNGGWFWFCVTQNGTTMSADVMVDFWKFIYNYMEEERGLTNLLWNYGPNTSGNVQNTPGGTMGPMYCYPGDEYVDMVGVDWYTSGNLEIRSGNNYLDMLDQTHKIGAITEFGVSGAVKAESYEEQHKLYNTDSLLIDLWTLLDDGYNFTYLLTWHNQSFCTIGAMGGEKGGFDFMNEDYTLGQADVKALFDALK